jgi:MYXO-CTERM domain-containing protein
VGTRRRTSATRPFRPPGPRGPITSYDRFATSGSKSLANDGKVTASNGVLTVSLDPQSVTTLRGSGGSTTGAGGASGRGGATGPGGTGGAPGAGGTTGEAGTGGGAAGTAGEGGHASGGAGATGTGGGGMPPDDGPADGGCSCRVHGQRPATSLVALLAAIVLVSKRRRRQRSDFR